MPSGQIPKLSKHREKNRCIPAELSSYRRKVPILQSAEHHNDEPRHIRAVKTVNVGGLVVHVDKDLCMERTIGDGPELQSPRESLTLST